MTFQYIACDFLAMSGLFLCQLLPLPIFHVRNAAALMQENLRRVTTDEKSQFVFNNLRKKLALVIRHTFLTTDIYSLLKIQRPAWYNSNPKFQEKGQGSSLL